MTLTSILILSGGTLALALLQRGRGWLLLIASVLVLYWLQPATPIRQLDFWLPTTSLALTVLVWAATQKESWQSRETLITASVLIGLILAIAALRYVEPLCCLTPTRPPDMVRVLVTLVIILGLVGVTHYISRFTLSLRIITLSLLIIFIALKFEPLTTQLSAALRALNSQPTEQASALDIRWLGFSYLAFRLLHVLRDRASGRLPALNLQEFVTYALFFPAFTSGPIDRAERFIKDLRVSSAIPTPEFLEGARRLLIGLFKKFALADTLALIALNDQNAAQVNSTLWLWAVVYAYAWRLYFDFSGYTDIALGLARWLGVRLPENFERPFAKPNLTQFWNSWHITLAQWFRAYFFNPVTRALRATSLPPAVIIFLGQAGTMMLIALWHGITWNFAAWGAWHAAGLFIHNRWADYAKGRYPQLLASKAWGVAGTVFTFHFVALGWVWFALSDVNVAMHTVLKLLGVNP